MQVEKYLFEVLGKVVEIYPKRRDWYEPRGI